MYSVAHHTSASTKAPFRGLGVVVRLLFLATLLLPLPATAQRVDKVRVVMGEYTYYAPSHVSVDEARAEAVRRARLQALADAYGTTLQSTTTTTVHNSATTSQVDVSTLAQSEVRGEWIEDVDEPQVDVTYEQDMLVVTARVRGRTRPVTTAQVQVEVRLLRNGTEPRYESGEFRAGDDLYLYFRTPAAGYVAVYLLDGEAAYCLLPYARDPAGIVRVGNDRPHVFFSADLADENVKPYVDELYLTATQPVEHNTVCVIFSPNPFAKATDEQRDGGSDLLLPRQTTLEGFNTWLTKCRVRDREMVVVRKELTIR